MKKSTLLSFATAAAIIATSAGTFAAWDQTKAVTDPVAITFRNKVTTTITTADFNENNAAIGTTPEFTSTPTIEVKDIPASVEKAEYNIVVKAYAYDTEAAATAAKTAADPSTNASTNVDVTTTNDTTSLETATNGKVTPTITVTPKDTLDPSTDGTKYILVVAELQEKTN